MQSTKPQLSERARSSRRSSMFNLRSKSNAADSVTSSTPSFPDVAEDEVPPRSPSLRQSRNSSPSRMSAAGSRKSLFRGKAGKRLSETVTPMVDQRDPEAGESKTAGRSVRAMRHRISSPFDFQHISHADRHQFASLNQVSSHNLNAELRAAHNSRQPARTQRLHRAVASSDNLMTMGQANQASPVEASSTTLRFTRSVDSFSQPSNGVYNHTRSQSALGARRPYSPFPLISIRTASDLVGEEDGSNSLLSPKSRRESSVWSAIGSSMTPEPSPGLLESPSYFEHALTTPDDSAIHASSPPFSPSLEDVAEEPEKFVKPRPAPQPPSRITVATLDSFSFRGQQSPKARSHSRGSIHASPKSPITRNMMVPPMSPTAHISEALEPTTLNRRMSIRRPTNNRRKSNTWRGIEASWEDDVDFIYENALEADCDSEWDSAPYSGTQNVPITQFQKLAVTSPYSVTNTLPQEPKDTREATYEELLEEYDDSDRHFPILDARQSAASSSRSSNIRSSGRSSYDSSMVSSAQSSVFWNSTMQRSASPTGSVSDLVPSQHVRKELAADQTVSLDSLDSTKEDDDMTPPGRPAQGRAFFASERI